jgi:flagellar basal-body rod modification protein FlgD
MPDPISGPGLDPTAMSGATIDPALLAPPDQFGKDMFLQLMVAQLKYQNPMSPMDGSEFMQQTAQFTTVEKLTELTEQLSTGLANDRVATASGMIGRQVTVGLAGGEAVATVTAVKLYPAGPALVLDDGTEVGLGDVVQIAQI